MIIRMMLVMMSFMVWWRRSILISRMVRFMMCMMLCMMFNRNMLWMGCYGRWWAILVTWLMMVMMLNCKVISMNVMFNNRRRWRSIIILWMQIVFNWNRDWSGCCKMMCVMMFIMMGWWRAIMILWRRGWWAIMNFLLMV